MRLARTWQYPDGAERLVAAPVFVLSSMRSGSTVLRRMLDNHSRICAPHEMHMSMWRVETDSSNARAALDAIDLTPGDLANLLWDRVMHLQLVKAQKSIIVDKTPRNTLQWKRIAGIWPDARFLVLLRHPARVAESLRAAHPEVAAETQYAEIERFAVALHDAQRGASSALTVRYEDLATDPEATTRRIAEWLNVPWEPAMTSVSERGRRLDGRGASDVPSLPDPVPGDIPDRLRKACELLGYL
jgi:sulfotransferase family protein